MSISPRRAVAYIRVSTDDQALGPDAQRAAIAAWAAREGMDLVAEHVDLGVSGAAELDKRPGLVAALDALEAGDVLVVAKRDRLARDTMAAAMIERLVERAGARIDSADGVGNGDSPEATLLRRMVEAFAAYELQVIRARTRSALAVKRGRGEFTGGQTPVGTRLAADGLHLEADPDEAELVRLVLEARKGGLSFRAIAAELDRQGFRTRKGGKVSFTQVARICDRAA